MPAVSTRLTVYACMHASVHASARPEGVHQDKQGGTQLYRWAWAVCPLCSGVYQDKRTQSCKAEQALSGARGARRIHPAYSPHGAG
jgi:hypothetical protein